MPADSKVAYSAPPSGRENAKHGAGHANGDRHPDGHRGRYRHMKTQGSQPTSLQEQRMLNLKGCVLTRYGSVIERKSEAIQRKIKTAYNNAEEFLEYTAVLIYAAYSPKASKISCDMGEIIRHIEKQAPEFKSMSKEQVLMGMDMVDTFNRMNSGIMLYKRDNPDAPLPYTKFEPCFWYFDALRILQEMDPEDYPLVNGWVEFFMFLPVMAGLGEDAPRSVSFRIIQYAWAIKKKQFDTWYRESKGYENSMNRNYKDMYIKELGSMNKEELQIEYDKRNWGRRLIKAEMGRR